MKYEYDVLECTVVDGDTVDLTIDLGFGLSRKDRFRLYGPDPNGKAGLNAPEMSTTEGKMAAAWLAGYLSTLLDNGFTLIAQTVKDRREKYGRYLVVLFARKPGARVTSTPVNINEMLLEQGYATLKVY